MIVNFPQDNYNYLVVSLTSSVSYWYHHCTLAKHSTHTNWNYWSTQKKRRNQSSLPCLNDLKISNTVLEEVNWERKRKGKRKKKKEELWSKSWSNPHITHYLSRIAMIRIDTEPLSRLQTSMVIPYLTKLSKSNICIFLLSKSPLCVQRWRNFSFFNRVSSEVVKPQTDCLLSRVSFVSFPPAQKNSCLAFGQFPNPPWIARKLSSQLTNDSINHSKWCFLI